MRTHKSETILVTESPLKMMKNAFNFNSKALSVLKILNDLIIKIRLISNFMMSQPG